MMASLKRYRQTSDSSANSARFRDLPPRFKRQKSITDSNAVDTHVQKQSSKPKKMPQTDGVISTSITDTFNADQIKNYDNKEKKMIRKGMANRQNLTFDRNFAKKSTQPIVLSPMDNNLFHFSQSDEQEYSSNNLSALNSFSWESQQPLQCFQYSYLNDTAIPQSVSFPYDGMWYEAPNGSVPKTKGSIHDDLGPMMNPYSETPSQPIKDYSERDQRIIEMFKELERVADQKEKEESENGADRKSLVSHHLRMLMCAIDKYTEGIEDDVAPESRDDEVPSTEEKPSPSISPNNGKTSTLSAIQDYAQPARVVNNTIEVAQPVTSLFNHNVQSCQAHQSSVIINNLPGHQSGLYNVSQNVNGHKSSESLSKFKAPMLLSAIDMQPWDLWSSPSFNGLDVYSHLSKGHNSCETADSTFALFDQLGMESGFTPRAEDCLTRTPLYKR